MASLLPPSRVGALRRRLLDHYDRHRRDLPWRRERDPYRIWVSEVILQQTRVETAIPFYRRWVERFPTLDALAAADREEVMAAWSGLGYYRRARHLHEAARVVRDRSGGELPSDARELRTLPGIGPYTAGAVASIAFGRREPAVDGNARRVLSRLFDLELPSAAELQERARALVPPDRPGDFNQALMELGATVCTPRNPSCDACPVAALCVARARTTQHLRPSARTRSQLPVQHLVVAVLIAPRGEMLVVRRPERGLLGGLWAFPAGRTEGRTEERTEVGAEDFSRGGAEDAERLARGLTAELECGTAVALGVLRQAFSHRIEIYHAWLMRVGRVEEIENGRWVTTDGLAHLAMPVAQRRIACAAIARLDAGDASRRRADDLRPKNIQ